MGIKCSYLYYVSAIKFFENGSLIYAYSFMNKQENIHKWIKRVCKHRCMLYKNSFIVSTKWNTCTCT